MKKLFHGIVVAVAGGLTVGIVGTDELGPTVPVTGDALAVGIDGAALTPRLLISVESNGTPARALPLVVVGDVDVGLDDEVTLLEPEPHIPDNPDVSSIPEDVDMPDVAAVAGVVVPVAIAIPPPS